MSIWIFSVRRCWNNLSPACPLNRGVLSYMRNFYVNHNVSLWFIFFLLFISLLSVYIHQVLPQRWWPCFDSSAVCMMSVVRHWGFLWPLSQYTSALTHDAILVIAEAFRLPAAPASGCVSQGERGWLPRQPRCALEPRHRHRESPQNGKTEGVRSLSERLCFLFLFILQFHLWFISRP